jgi:pimeloyl-ACP methyl ester carboxylesterase
MTQAFEATPPAASDCVSEPRLDYVMCASPAGTHRMAYWEWGDPDNDDVLLCVHGLTRTGRDFDALARRMADKYRVVCPDIAGRGKSDWLLNAAFYAVPQYVADILTLIARLAPRRLDWVGTSMGGLIGLGLVGALSMSASARPANGAAGLPADETLPLGKFVLNDIGPALDFRGLSRIGSYVGEQMSFDSFSQAVDYVHSVSQGFGQHDRKAWEELTRYVFVERDGRWVKHYDLRIRGELSDLLTAETAAQMLKRNPRASLHTVEGVGHAPTLRSDLEIDPVAAFLLG